MARLYVAQTSVSLTNPGSCRKGRPAVQKRVANSNRFATRFRKLFPVRKPAFNVTLDPPIAGNDFTGFELSHIDGTI